MDNTNNKKFWDDYVLYWEGKVDEANASSGAKDKTIDNNILKIYLDKLDVKNGDNFLDYGCGSGRLYAVYKNIVETDNYYGIDISRVSLQHAEYKNADLQLGRNLYEFDGENIPFQDNYFDKIMCFCVFDACKQETVIRQLLRVLKCGDGKLVISGKNNKYFSDDEAASIAEVNARKKAHPNYFTDVPYFKEELLRHNAHILEEYYFLRRGDFPNNRFVLSMPEIFYEWVLVINKDRDYIDTEYNKFSSMYSKVFN